METSERKHLVVHVDKLFTIIEEEIPSAGYLCDPDYDWQIFELNATNRHYPDDEHALPIGGVVSTHFIFQALHKGKHTIVMEHKRPWESMALKKIYYDIEVI